MTHCFYGWQNSKNITAINSTYGEKILHPADLYDALLNVWCEYSCAPRMRVQWSESNITLGQCSITAFLAQDIFGGQVFGTETLDGDCHCFNFVDGLIFDLTSEQFNYDLTYKTDWEQFRAGHFENNHDKFLRYEYLKSQLLKNASRCF